MNTFKVKKIGLDLRNPKGNISALGLEGNKNKNKIDYLLLDLLCAKEYFTNTFCTLLETTQETKVYLEIDLSKFNPEDPWKEAWKVYRTWRENNYWKTYSTNYTILFKNLPKELTYSESKSLEKWKAYPVGLEFTDIKEWQKELDLWRTYFSNPPEIVARSISPLYYNPEMEKYILDLIQPKELIGLDYHGGYRNKEREREIFSESYLLSFSGMVSETIFIPIYSDYLKEAADQVGFLSELVGRPVEDKEKAKFTLKKLVTSLKDAPKKLVYVSGKLSLAGEVWEIPVDETTMLYPYSDILYSFSKPRQKSHLIEKDPTEVEIAAEVKIDGILGSARERISPEVAWRLSTLEVVNLVKEYYPEEEQWQMDFVEIGKYAIGINLVQVEKKRWWNKYAPDIITETRDLILIMTTPEDIRLVDLDSIPFEDEDSDEND